MTFTPSIALRFATDTDAAAINDIYNYYVATSTCTAQLIPDSLESRRAWLATHPPDQYPVIIATSSMGEVVGWASLSPYSSRGGYAKTVENSIYVHPDHQRRGIGKVLGMALVLEAKRIGHKVIVAGIEASQAASIALHVKLGFLEMGRLTGVMEKFGRPLDKAILQKTLGEGPALW
ncbi:putative acetyltransferase [Blastocladiella britannica]|nr:putative acetyltransferase [Blastocladiella britannica]